MVDNNSLSKQNNELFIEAIKGCEYISVARSMINKILSSDTELNKRIAVFISNPLWKELFDTVKYKDRLTFFTEDEYVLSRMAIGKGTEKQRAELIEKAIEESKAELGESRVLNLGTKFFMNEFSWMHSKLVGYYNLDEYLSLIRKGIPGSEHLLFEERKQIIHVYKKYFINLSMNSQLYVEKGEILLHLLRIVNDPQYDWVFILGAEDMTQCAIKLFMNESRSKVFIGFDPQQSVNPFSIKNLREVGVPFSSIKSLKRPMRTTKQIDEFTYSIYGDSFIEHYVPEVEGEIPQIFVVSDEFARQDCINKYIRGYIQKYDNLITGMLLPNMEKVEMYCRLMSTWGYFCENSSKEINVTTPGIKIMTYNQSKGIEFDAVIIPEFDIKDAYTHVAILRAKHRLILITSNSYPLEHIDSRLYVLNVHGLSKGQKKSVLSSIIEEYPKCLNDRKILKSLILDFIHDKGLSNILLFAYDEGIVVEIQNGAVDELSIHRFVKKLENNYGMTEEKAMMAVEEWMDAFDVII